jgi:glutamate-ammonia-ligase adenylyltransferase
LRQQFEKRRKQFLCQPRETKRLRIEVLSMRQKMRDHLDQSSEEFFDIKQGLGGIIDLEFLVQFLILTHANAHPDITTYSDNIRQLQGLADAGLLTEEERASLSQAYLGLRGLAHKAALAKTEATSPLASVSQWTTVIVAAWVKYLG